MMERTKGEHVNGREPLPNSQPEPFSIHDRATGKHRSVREMTDAELARHIGTAQQEMASYQNAVMQANQNLMSIGQMMAIMLFETHRRSVGLVIASELPK